MKSAMFRGPGRVAAIKGRLGRTSSVGGGKLRVGSGGFQGGLEEVKEKRKGLMWGGLAGGGRAFRMEGG